MGSLPVEIPGEQLLEVVAELFASVGTPFVLDEGAGVRIERPCKAIANLKWNTLHETTWPRWPGAPISRSRSTVRSRLAASWWRPSVGGRSGS
ncbi:MAG: hypothetical protein ABI175_19180 [Polyangiales bacterium]